MMWSWFSRSRSEIEENKKKPENGNVELSNAAGDLVLPSGVDHKEMVSSTTFQTNREINVTNNTDENSPAQLSQVMDEMRRMIQPSRFVTVVREVAPDVLMEIEYEVHDYDDHMPNVPMTHTTKQKLSKAGKRKNKASVPQKTESDLKLSDVFAPLSATPPRNMFHDTMADAQAWSGTQPELPPHSKRQRIRNALWSGYCGTWSAVAYGARVTWSTAGWTASTVSAPVRSSILGRLVWNVLGHDPNTRRAGNTLNSWPNDAGLNEWPQHNQSH